MEPKEAEINSFVTKFKQLWKAGLSAHLDMNTNAGQAWIGIRLQLGGDSKPKFGQDKKYSSRERRRMRRAASNKPEISTSYNSLAVSEKCNNSQKCDVIVNKGVPNNVKIGDIVAENVESTELPINVVLVNVDQDSSSNMEDNKETADQVNTVEDNGEYDDNGMNEGDSS